MRTYSRNNLLALLLAVAMGAGTGCLGLGQDRAQGTSVPERPLALRPIAPTKDEVLLVDGRAISIAGFYALRTQLKNPSTEAVLWAGVATLVLQKETRGRGGELSTVAAVEIARYAMGELSLGEAQGSLRDHFGHLGPLPTSDQTKREIERLVSKSDIQRNPSTIASLGPAIGSP
jgi:hypothetical protein